MDKMSLDKIDKISNVSKKVISEVDPAQAGGVKPDKNQFDALMRQEEAKKAAPAIESQAARPTPMEEATRTQKTLDITHKASHQELLAQLDATIKRIDSVKATLDTQSLNLKDSVQTMMKKKLLHIDETLKNALARVGTVEPTAAAGSPADGAVNPVQRFLGLLSEGQSKLYSLSDSIAAVSAKQEISPASVLAIQIKVGMVQHQIELFTALLNKALESTKTIMNVQV
jgi:hypothetical protein